MNDKIMNKVMNNIMNDRFMNRVSCEAKDIFWRALLPPLLFICNTVHQMAAILDRILVTQAYT